MADFERDLLYYGGINPFTGSMKLSGNITMGGNGSYIRDLAVDQLTVTGNAVIPGLSFDSLTVTENITTGGNFIGNGTLLTGLPPSPLPAIARMDIIGNVVASGNVEVAGHVNVAGGVEGEYFIGDASLLENVISANGGPITFTIGDSSISTSNLTLTGDKYLSVAVSDTSLDISATVVNTPGNLIALPNVAVIRQIHLDGYLVVPKGYVADEHERLAIAAGKAPVGTLLSQTDTGNVFLLTATPSNIANNWIEVGEGNTYHVTSVLGRTGDVFAAYGDHADNTVVLSQAVGDVPEDSTIADALEMLQTTKANIVGGNITASYFIGDGSRITGVKTGLPLLANVNVVGNVSAPGDISGGGDLNSIGNVECGYIKGNCSLLTGTNYTSGGTLTTDLIASNVLIFSNEMTFMWNASYFNDPRTDENNIMLATQLGPTGEYLSDITGRFYQLYSAPNMVGGLVWQTGFDFSRDFDLSFSTQTNITNGSGTLWVSVGGSTDGYNTMPTSLNNGALTAFMNLIYPDINQCYGSIYYNGTTVPNSINNTALHLETIKWVPYTLSLRTLGSRRFLSLINNWFGTTEASADVTFWNPSGSFMAVGARGIGSATRNLTSVSLEYV